MTFSFVAPALLAVLVSSTASAGLITFEPDDYAVGTSVSNANPLVSLSNFRKYGDTAQSPTFAPVSVADCFAGTECVSTTGTRVFGDGYGGKTAWGAFGGSIQDAVRCFRGLGQGAASPGCGGQGFNVMLMTFADPTAFVEISGAYWAQDETELYGFDDSFNLVGAMSHTFDFNRCRGAAAVSDYCHTTVSLASQSAGIRYVLAGGWSNGTSLDNLRFNVPEPGTLALLAFGLACAGVARRKKMGSHAAR